MEVPANEGVRDSRATAQAGTDREAENAVAAGVELVPSLQACRAAKRNGKPCRSTILLADGFCWVHSSSSPATPAERGRKGGLASGEVRREQGRSVRDRLREKVEELLFPSFPRVSDIRYRSVEAAPAARRGCSRRGRCYVRYGGTGCVPQSPPPSSRLAGIGSAGGRDGPGSSLVGSTVPCGRPRVACRQSGG
jgi:hypothetical protein